MVARRLARVRRVGRISFGQVHGSLASCASFSDQLGAQLDAIAAEYDHLLDRSAIRNVDPNRSSSDFYFVDAPSWGWVPDQALDGERTDLLQRFDDWYHRFRLLHRRALPETDKAIADATSLLRRWLERPRDRTIPPTIDLARSTIREQVTTLRRLLTLGTTGKDGEMVLVPDTNALMHNPDVAAYADVLGRAAYTVVLVPTVIRELDDLKDRGRTSDIRDQASRVVKRIKGFRDRGRLPDGVKVAGQVNLRAEAREVQAPSVLEWLDPAVPDDRIIAAALDIQASAAAAIVVLATRDLNLQTKADVVGLPFVEPPPPESATRTSTTAPVPAAPR